MSDSVEREGMSQLCALARQLPEVEEGVACAGTAVEKRTFRARGKNFLFLGVGPAGWNAMLKVTASLSEAQALAAAQPERYKVGANGWVTVTVPQDEGPPEPLLRWLAESRQAVLPKPKAARGG